LPGLSNFDSNDSRIPAADANAHSETGMEANLQGNAMGRAMANNGLVVESGRRERKQALVADESLSPAFRGFIEIWARKIENVGQRAIGPRSAGMGAMEEFNSPPQQDLV
jgi:hypothetical protein